MFETELIINEDGSIYHLALHPGELAEKIFFVGDQNRVEKLGQYFDEIEFIRQKREFKTLTGRYQGERMSVVSTGIGTDNVDIVWNEIDALFNIDFATRSIHKHPRRIKALRLGTCGGLQREIPVNTLVLSAFAIGADNLMSFYEQQASRGIAAKFSHHWQQFLRHSGLKIPLYLAQGSPHLTTMVRDLFRQIEIGITFTASGFYGPQGRSLGRLPTRWPNLPDRISHFFFPDMQLRVLNMEMETSAVLGLGKALGHEAGSLCVILANRQTGEFAPDPKASVDKVIRTGLEIMRNWN